MPTNINLDPFTASISPNLRHQRKHSKRQEAADSGIPKSKGCEDVLVYDPAPTPSGQPVRYVKGVSRADLVAAGWDDAQIAQYQKSNPDILVY